ncbi:preprotein translocase subunit SecE [Cognatiluteimonas profundi]|uniref:preprotein translocase subunit SecE n=1 Tax=Cognatiluteimonas profundi TaxID=2594501 RepID=UPI00131BD9EC|nr:preprotein translocase subunit SecE [Lysobacter profundi]
MNSKIQQSKAAGAPGDMVKYALAILLIAAGVFAFYWFGQWPSPVRVLVVVAGLVAAGLVFLTTGKGGHTKEFLSEARFELRKVVWPSRQEALRTTWVVIAVVIALSLMLAFFDIVIQSAVKWLLAR